MEQGVESEKNGEKFWPINWRNNSFTKIIFAVEFLSILAIGALYAFAVNYGDGGGVLGVLFILPVMILGGSLVVHLVLSIFFIEKDKIDRLSLLFDIGVLILSTIVFLQR